MAIATRLTPRIVPVAGEHDDWPEALTARAATRRTMVAHPPSVAASGNRPTIAVGVLGFALGGFFDGIMLHQVLQWHHFLSLVPGEALRDIRAQILADGMFHVAVYAIATLGLWLIWRAHDGLDAAGGRRLLGAALLGFGAWQVVDVVGFHWVVGIHRIRVDVPNPLLWDVGWLGVVGLPPLLAGLWLRRSATGGGRPPQPGQGGHGRAAAAMLALSVIGAAPLASLPPLGAAATTTVVVLFRPGLGLEGAFAAVAAADGRVVWADASGELLTLQLGPQGSAWQLYRHGALVVGTSGPVAGCLAWTKV
jgi:uncharacterized membrane protein